MALTRGDIPSVCAVCAPFQDQLSEASRGPDWIGHRNNYLATHLQPGEAAEAYAARRVEAGREPLTSRQILDGPAPADLDFDDNPWYDLNLDGAR
jgi:hypothetical protein